MEKARYWIGVLGLYSTLGVASEGSAALAGNASAWGNVLLLVGFLVLFYFMLIRPQQKRMREQQKMIQSIAPSDEVVTNGGLVGEVLRVTDQFFVVSIAQGVEVKVQKQAIISVLPKGTLRSI